ncbi:lysylphosphatidylglycerol synthase domain-containing protein [Nocardia sp.]|uniref:lysylphosphatidylglycerol synthase domain-containing protein n=1 Tax=Nocardia sp. TaxID=1821 RepID=UPI00258A93E9|nr:lysylphosphatidylglycerol synthase domain-containing protein [Nocardia sp.]
MTTDTTSATPSMAAATIPAAPSGIVIQRHPGDVVRVVLGIVALIASTAIVWHARVPRLEKDLFHLINDLPSWVMPVLWLVMQLGSLGAVVALSSVALVARKFRMARDLAAAGTLAYVLALVVKSFVGRARPDMLLTELNLRTHQGGLGFVSGHAAVAAALAAAAAPWLPRPWRRVAWAAAAAVGLARVFVGAHLVLDVFGGAALGWTVAAALHLLWGAPVHRCEAPALSKALAAAGLHPVAVSPVRLDARGSRPFLVTTENGTRADLFVKVIGYHERNSDLLFKLFRHLVFRELEDESPFATPKQEAEHEAFIALLAYRVGVRTPPVISVGVAENGDAWLAEARIPGRDLGRSNTEPISDKVLSDVWCQVALLRAARIAHRDLRLANILLDEHGDPWIIDFGFSETGASQHRLDADVAELLVSMSLKVGAERSVASALRVLGSEALVGAAPLLQPLALASATRSAARDRHGLIDEIRHAVAEATDTPLSTPEVIVRFRWRTLGWIVATIFATYVLLPQVGQLGRTISALDDARWQWLLAALAMSALTYATAAATVLGASPRPLAFGRTMKVQLATSFANRLAPYGIGGTAVNERYLERSGLPRGTAVATIAVIAASGVTLHLLQLLGAGVWLGQSRQLLDSALPSGWVLLAGFVVTMAALGAAIALLIRRPDWLAEVRGTATSMVDVLRRPRGAALVLTGQIGGNIAYIAALGFAVYAFGGTPSPALLTAVFLGGSALGAASPTPAGLGVVEASLVAGLLVGGVPDGPAVAGVLAYRLVTFWLPAALGFFAFKSLERHHLL